MADVRPVRIGSELVTTEETISVPSPFDGHEIARVPSCTDEHVEQAVRAAQRAMAEPLPPWRRAEILDRAALAVADQHEPLARTIAEEAAKPIATARVEASRCVLTFQSAAIEA